MVVLQRHLQSVVLGSIFIHLGARLIHLLPGRRGDRFLRVVPRDVVFIFFLILVVPLLGFLLICRYGHRSEPSRRKRGLSPHCLEAFRGSLAAAVFHKRHTLLPKEPPACRWRPLPQMPPTRPTTQGAQRSRISPAPAACRDSMYSPRDTVGSAAAAKHRAATTQDNVDSERKQAPGRRRHVSPRSPRSLLPMATTAPNSRCLRVPAADVLRGASPSHRKLLRQTHRKSRL